MPQANSPLIGDGRRPQHALPEALRANVEHRYYAAGHMMYVHEPSRVQQSADLADFVRRCTAR